MKELLPRFAAVMAILCMTSCGSERPAPATGLRTPQNMKEFLLNAREAVASGLILREEFFTEDNLKRAFAASVVSITRTPGLDAGGSIYAASALSRPGSSVTPTVTRPCCCASASTKDFVRAANRKPTSPSATKGIPVRDSRKWCNCSDQRGTKSREPPMSIRMGRRHRCPPSPILRLTSSSSTSSAILSWTERWCRSLTVTDASVHCPPTPMPR
jgi:hypothetical protein